MANALLNEVSILNIAGHDNDIKDAFTRQIIANEEPLDVSTRKYTTNQFFIWNDRNLYRTLTTINVNGRFVVGSNVKKVTVGEMLAEIYKTNPERAMTLIANIEDDEYPMALYDVGDYIIRNNLLWEVIQKINYNTKWQSGVNITPKFNIAEIITGLEKGSYSISDGELTTIEDDDFVPFVKSDLKTKAKIKFSSLLGKLRDTFAPFNHADTTTSHGGGTATKYGHVKLSDSYLESAGTADDSVAASAQALRDCYGAMEALKAPRVHYSTNASSYGAGNATNFGHVKLSDSYSTNEGAASKSVAASQKAVYDLYKVLNGRVSSDVKFWMGKSSTDAPCLLGKFTLDDQTYHLMLYLQYPNSDGNRRLTVFDSDWNTIWQI